MQYNESSSSPFARGAPSGSEPPLEGHPRLSSLRHCSYAHTRYPEMVTSFCLLPAVRGSCWCAEHALSPETRP